VIILASQFRTTLKWRQYFFVTIGRLNLVCRTVCFPGHNETHNGFQKTFYRPRKFCPEELAVYPALEDNVGHLEPPASPNAWEQKAIATTRAMQVRSVFVVGLHPKSSRITIVERPGRNVLSVTKRLVFNPKGLNSWLRSSNFPTKFAEKKHVCRGPIGSVNAISFVNSGAFSRDRCLCANCGIHSGGSGNQLGRTADYPCGVSRSADAPWQRRLSSWRRRRDRVMAAKKEQVMAAEEIIRVDGIGRSKTVKKSPGRATRSIALPRTSSAVSQLPKGGARSGGTSRAPRRQPNIALPVIRRLEA